MTCVLHTYSSSCCHSPPPPSLAPMKTVAHKGGGAGGCSSTPQPKLGSSCNSSRFDDFLYGGWGGTYAYCLSMLAAACLSSYRQTNQLSLYEVRVLVQLTLTKILKIVATRWRILRLKCTTIDFGWGSAPDPAGELTALPQTPDLGAYF